MKSTVQILAQGKRRSFKEGKFVLHECQCVVLGDDVVVGVLKISDRAAKDILVPAMVPAVDDKGQPLMGPDGRPQLVSQNVVPPGAYELEYGLGVGWDDKELGGVLKSIVPVGRGNPALAALNSSAAGEVKSAPSAKV